MRVTDGTDTFVFSDDAIRVHTLHYTTEPLPRRRARCSPHTLRVLSHTA